MKNLDLTPIQNDFRNFLFLVWQFLGLPEPTKRQYEIAYYLQHGSKLQIIQAFRGVGKSWITSAYVLWSLFNDPQQKFLVVSASKERADAFSSFTLRLINEMPLLQHLKPDEKRRQRSSLIAFDVAPATPAHAPSVKSVGIFGQMTGSRATHIIADDIEVLNNSDTEDKREKLLKTVGEFVAIGVPEGYRITFLGTPQTEDSIYSRLHKERGYDCRIWPARFPKQEKMNYYGNLLAEQLLIDLENGSKPGDPVDPARFGEVDLIEREGTYGRSDFMLQFMLDTTLSDAEKYPLKTSDLVVMSVGDEKAPISISWGSSTSLKYPNVGFSGDQFHPPIFIDEKWDNYSGAVMFIDPSGKGADETAYAVVKQLHGMLFLLDSGGFRGGYDDQTLEGLAQVAKLNHVHLVLVEANFGQGMFTQLFMPILRARCSAGIEEITQRKQKELRIIDTLEPLMNRHKLVVNEAVVQKDMKLVGERVKYSLFYQMTHITKDRGAIRHDDRLDALAGAVEYFVGAMAQSTEDSIKAHNQREMTQMLEDFAENVLGKTRKQDSWLSRKCS